LESENAQLKSATQEMQRLIPGTLGKTSPMYILFYFLYVQVIK